MKQAVFCIFLFISSATYAQQNASITIIDFVKIKNDRIKEAIYYYENNWKVYRDTALKAGYISSYKILKTTADSVGGFHLMLITEYADSVQYNLSEERFGKIIEEISPAGPKLLNEIKPAGFRINVFFKKADTLFEEVKRENQRM
jgi:hypothetical protein